MNSRVLRGLLMEHTTRTWPFFVSGLILGFVYLVFQWEVQGRTYQSDVEAATQAIVLFIAALGLLYSAADSDRLTCELTERTLLLPVPTVVIVGARFFNNMASIAGLSILVHILLRISPFSGPHDDWWAYPLLGVMILSVLQTVALVVGCLGDWALGILVAAFIVTTAFVGEYGNEIATTSLIAMQFALFGVCLLISCGVVHLRRTGRWDPQLLLPQAASLGRRKETEPLVPFKTAFEAQRWFEVRRIRGYFAAIYIVSASTVALFSVIQRYFVERFLEDYTTGERLLWAAGQYGIMLVYVFLGTSVFVGGIILFQNFRMQRGPLRAFLFLRPMTTADLGRARFEGALRCLAGTYLPIVLLTLAFCSLWLAIGKDNPSTLLTQRWTPIQLAAILIIIFSGVAAAGWVAFWTGNIIGMFALVIGFEMLRTFLNDYGWLNYFSESSEWISVAGIAVVMGIILIVAVQRGFLAMRRLGISLVATTAFAGALWFAGYWEDIWSNREVPWNFNELYTYAPIALFMILPTASIPLTLHWARHR